MENKHTISDLQQMQSLPLSAKIRMTCYRIRQWVDEYGTDGCYVSFSGGKDSTVLLDIVRNECGYKDIPAVFVDVPTQYPELRDFAKKYDNIIILRPHISFMEVCEKYGFPLISKDVSQAVFDVKTQARLSGREYRDAPLWHRNFDENSEYCKKYPQYSDARYDYFFDADFDISHKCCNVMKKDPAKKYEKETGRKAILGIMTEESQLRRTSWLKYGCNAFNSKRPTSRPMSFWKEQDVLEYIVKKELPICSVYGDVVEDHNVDGQLEGQIKLWEERPTYKTTGCKRTGCMLCGFGCHLDKPGEGRFERLKETHPKMYGLLDVCKNNGVTFREAIEWTNEHGNLDIKL